MNGIIVIDKPMDYTSFDIIAILKGVLGEKHLGHTGTLDPNATGVLPICIGNAAKLIEYMDICPKEYIAQAQFGLSTDTQDIWGNVLSKKEYIPVSKEILLKTLSDFTGVIDQIPSKYSAVRVNGRHLYSYAHSGDEVEIPSRKVSIYSIDLLSFDENSGSFSIKVKCGRGTYIRTLCSDIGERLGPGAALTSLRRTSACGYSVSDALNFEKVRTMTKEELSAYIMPIESAVSGLNRVDITQVQKQDFANGKHLKVMQNDMNAADPVCVFCDNELCGIGFWDNPNRIKPKKVFIR